MGAEQTRAAIKQHLISAGNAQIQRTIQRITTLREGWKHDPAPKNADITYKTNPHKNLGDPWLYASGKLASVHSFNTTIYKSPQGFTMYVKGKKKHHPMYRGKNPPTYQQLLNYWNTGNPGFPHGRYYSGAVNPRLDKDIDEALKDNIMEEFRELWKETSKKIKGAM